MRYSMDKWPESLSAAPYNRRISDNSGILIDKRLFKGGIIEIDHEQHNPLSGRPVADNEMVAAGSFKHTRVDLGVPVFVILIGKVEGADLAKVESEDVLYIRLFEHRCSC